MAWTPHGYGNQQDQHFQLLDHRLLIWARGSKDERFGCLFREIPYYGPVAGIGDSSYPETTIKVERGVNIYMYMIGHGPSDGSRAVGQQLLFETVQSRDSIVAQPVTVAGYVLRQRSQAVSGAPAKKLSTCEL
jgi:hypothetical protein